jgi:hypothetical protein
MRRRVCWLVTLLGPIGGRAHEAAFGPGTFGSAIDDLCVATDLTHLLS